jgi:hypothetical protein
VFITHTQLSVFQKSAISDHVRYNTIQRNLVITPDPLFNETVVTVDDLQVAHFLYLVLENNRIRQLIDKITTKMVLILGRLTPKRKLVLDTLRETLRQNNYVPVVFDFEKPANRDVTETVTTLAHMARFIVADLTDAKSIPQELTGIVPNLPSVPVQPLIAGNKREYGMFEHFVRYPWVLPIHRYKDLKALLEDFPVNIIPMIERKVRDLRE